MQNPDLLSRDQIIADNPLLTYCEKKGWQMRREGREFKCICPFHNDHHPSFNINPEKGVWICRSGCGGGSVIDLHARLRGIPAKQAMRELSGEVEMDIPRRSTTNTTISKETTPVAPAYEQRKEVVAYDYQDATGAVVYQVVRYEPKDFKQCKIDDGVRIWNMDGVERLPYRLPELLSNPASVWIVEGEKDVETLRSIGQTATCNPGGVGKWLPAFSQHLKGKCVYIAADNDSKGQAHGKEILKSLAGLVEWVKWVSLPPEFKDVSELRNSCQDNGGFIEKLTCLQDKARLIEGGIDSQSFTMAELEQQYIAEKTAFDGISLDLNRWLPDLNLRKLGPGDLMGLIANTGQCKTAAVQNILACNAGIHGIVFEIELSGAQMFERAAAISTGINAWRISQIYDEKLRVDWKTSGKFKNILICTSSLSMAGIDEEIARSSAKLGRIPSVFVIDYAQLVKGHGSRYDRMSETCETAKMLAKKWNCIGILISQVGRPSDAHDSEVGIYDAKESGSFENSCGLVLGVWKTSENAMSCKILKNTKGYGGKEVKMKLIDNTYIIEPA